MGEGIQVRFGETKRLPDGTRIVVERKKRPHEKRKGGKTARHEARHIVAAELNGTRVLSASVIPGPGYLGITFLSGPDAAAAAAPDAHGDDGTGHDMRIVKQMGVSPEGARHAGKMLLKGKEEHVEAVATALDAAGTLSGSAIREVMRDIDEGDEVTIKIYAPDGTLETKRQRQKNPHGVFVSESELPKAAKDNEEKNRKEKTKRFDKKEQGDFLSEWEIPRVAA
jgi:hypothetical protein